MLTPCKFYVQYWSGARYFKSNLVKEWPKKENTLEDRVKRVYERSMRHDDIPLLSTWESYASSLPVREFKDSGYLGSSYVKPLYKYPYWSNEKDLADRLIHVKTTTGGTPRGLVKYLSTPTRYGKTSSTSSILPAFLYSAEKGSESNEKIGLTHYLYLPFNNNDGNHFKAKGKICASSAREQGSAFIVKCLKSLLAAKLGETFVIDQNPDSQTISKNEIETLFSFLSIWAVTYSCTPR